jgi:L-lactate utilization protein LutC
MTTARDRFLETVRRAVAEGNRAGQVTGQPERGAVGYQGCGPDALARFRDELTAAGGQCHVVPDRAAAAARVVELVRACGARRVLLGPGALLDSLHLAEQLRAAGSEVLAVEPSADDAKREAFFRAEVGITGVDHLIAETGSIVIFSRPEQPRSASLLPPVHIAVATRNQIVPDLFDLFERQREQPGPSIPACVSLITGPSKTGDIELKLVTGVHGPGEVHVVVIESNEQGQPTEGLGLRR